VVGGRGGVGAKEGPREGVKGGTPVPRFLGSPPDEECLFTALTMSCAYPPGPNTWKCKGTVDINSSSM
jgi:hypothetical protein